MLTTTKTILILSEDPTQGLDNTTLTSEKIFNWFYWKYQKILFKLAL